MDKYIKLLEVWDGKSEDLCYELYMMLKKENTGKIKKFQLLCEKVVEIDSDESKKIESYFEEGEIDKLRSLYGKYINQSIISVRKKTSFQKLGIEEFYNLLWNTVIENSLLTTDKEKAFGLFWILADNSIPYYELGEPLAMKDDEYKEIIQNNKEAEKRIRYIFSVPFEQRTEVSSLILQELLKNNDYKVQAVLLAQAFTYNLQMDMRKLESILGAVEKTNKTE